MRWTKPGEQHAIFLQLDRGDPTRFPVAVIVNKTGAFQAAVSLVPVVGVPGRYLGYHTFLVEGDYAISFTVYEDAGHTAESGRYRLGDEVVRCSALEQQLGAIQIGTPVADFG